MLDIPDPDALVCGYRVDADGAMDELAWADMDAALAREDSVVWLHFNLADVRAKAWIEGCPRLPGAARAILLGADNHMRIEPAGNGLAGVVGDLHHEFAQKADQLDVLRLYLDNRCLISARRRPLQAVDKLRRQIGDGLKVEKPVALVSQFLHHATDTLGDLINELGDVVDDIEDALLAGAAAPHSAELARVRRVAARLRRHMIPQQHALIGLAQRLPAWIEGDDANGLRGAIERLSSLGHDLDLVQERARLLQDQLSNKLMEATNKNLYVLSIVTTIFLPMTLLTGIFGMNLGGLPAQQDPLGFWYGIVLMIGLGLVTVWALRRRRML